MLDSTSLVCLLPPISRSQYPVLKVPRAAALSCSFAVRGVAARGSNIRTSRPSRKGGRASPRSLHIRGGRSARGPPDKTKKARAQNENAPCWPAASCSPTDYTAVPSALGGLTSGFGTGPGVPPLPWPPANKGRSHPPAPPARALRAAQRSKAPPGPGPRPHALPAPAGGGIE